MSDTESVFQPTGSNHNTLHTDEILNDHRNQNTNAGSAIIDDDDDDDDAIDDSYGDDSSEPVRSNQDKSQTKERNKSKTESDLAEGGPVPPVSGPSGRRKSTRRGSARRQSVGEGIVPSQYQHHVQPNRSYMTSLRKDFYLKDDEDNTALPIPIINNPSSSAKARSKSTVEALAPIIKKKTHRSNSNNLEADISSPMTKIKTNDSFIITNNGNGEEVKIRRPSRSSIDSEADSHGSRTSQETEEDVCFPMMREHVKVNGIDFDEIDEFIREEREEDAMQREFLTKNQSAIEEISHETSRKFENYRQGSSVNGVPSNTSGISRQPTSTAALKYTPKNILHKTFQRSKEVTESTSTTSSSLEELKARQALESDEASSTEQVKFGGARITDGTNGTLPDRFSFFHSESEETVHAPDIPSLVPNGESIQELFHNGEETWWLDCTCPTDAEMKMLAKAFGIHPLTAEDIRMQETREKVELFKSYYFVCFHTFEADKESEDYLEPINVYIVVFRDGILTFHFSPLTHPANVRRRVRQLRDYVDVTADWLCYAMIDDITDSFAPVIHGIEYEADAIEDAVFTARETDFSNMLQRIGESRRKVMTLMRLLSGKADVIKMFAKRCQDEAALGYEKQQQQLRQQRYHQEYASPRSSSANIPETHLSGGATPSNSSNPHNGVPPSSRDPPAWSQSMTDNARPRADIALYLGDIQDHIITMFQNLLAYEKIFSRSHSNYLAQLQVESFNSNNKITQMFSKVTIIGTMLVPLNLVTGLFGMNVTVPGQDSSIAWFFGIVGVLIVVVCASIIFANWWLKSINKQIDDENRVGFNSSRRSIRSLGLRRHSAKSVISFPNKYD
ncbi:ALR1 [Candida metapsilosis]|uniref:ALR1 n=1 Tax=Candida metapsilosis TaxID=273372 RepID=A0A8H7ZGE9_9ASCO|nr:ALR1 [Candida metapsilosis]